MASPSQNTFGVDTTHSPLSEVAATATRTEAETHTEEHKTTVVQRILLGELTAERACEQEGLTTEELTEWVRVYRRATRRAVDDQLAAALSAQGLEVDDFVLSGNLESMAVAELIQTIQYGRKDAHIRIEHDGAHSHIWCMDGDVIDARSSALIGAPAVYRLLSLCEGRLQADFSKVLRPRTIEASTQALMLESAKRFDECRALRERIGDTLQYYVQSATSVLAEAQLTPAELEVLRAFDGSRDVETVVRESALPDLESLALIARLLSERWLSAKPVPAFAAGAERTPASSAERTPASSAERTPAERTLPSPAERTLPSPSASLPLWSKRGLELSVVPFAASLRARLSEPVNTRRWVWAGLLTGAAALPLAFAVGFWSARQQAVQAVVREVEGGRRAAAAGLASAVCGADMALVSTGARAASGAGFEPGDVGATRPYCLSQREIKTDQFADCVAAGKCQAAQTDFEPAALPSLAEASNDALAHCNAGRPGHERYPINCVTFQQAAEYCAWRGARLPTELEWEHAATANSPAGESTPDSIAELSGGVAEWTSGHVGTRSPGLEGAPDLHVVLGGGLAKAKSRTSKPS